MHTRNVGMSVAGAMTVAVLSLGSGGCQQERTVTPETPSADPVLREQYPKITTLDGLGRFLAIAEPTVEQSDAYPMFVSVPVRAITEGESLSVQYRFSFLDSRGVPIAPERMWQYVAMPSQNQRFFQATAMDSRAVDWRLEIRPAR